MLFADFCGSIEDDRVDLTKTTVSHKIGGTIVCKKCSEPITFVMDMETKRWAPYNPDGTAHRPKNRFSRFKGLDLK